MITFLITQSLNGAIAKLRVAGRAVADSYTFNYTIAPGDTVELGIWIYTDTDVNGLSAYLHFDTVIIGINDLNPSVAGIQLGEDTASFDNVTLNSSENDTIDYSALASSNYFQGDTIVAHMEILGKSIGETIALIWDFEPSRNTVIETAGTNILTGVDTVYIYVRPDSVQNLRASVDVTTPGTGCVLEWTEVTDTGVNGYLVYRATQDLNYTLISSLVTGTTTYTDDTAWFGQTYFWVVTAADTDITPRAESEFSDSISAPYIQMNKTLYKIKLGAADTKVIPGSSLHYTIVAQSKGFDALTYVLIDDELDTSFVVFDTNIVVPAGWTQLFAHIENPDRSYTSTDFDTNDQNVRWIRFKKSYMSIGDSVTFEMRLRVK